MTGPIPALAGQARRRCEVCVVLAGRSDDEHLQRCLGSVHANVPAGTSVESAAPSTASVNDALRRIAPADAVVLTEPCLVTAGWLDRMRAAALDDTNTATASALADAGTELSLLNDVPGTDARAARDIDELANSLTAHTLALRPRLTRAVGPCVYVRREAIELVGALDEELDLPTALEIDFAQRCLLSGLAHVAADDVVVGRLVAERAMPQWLERYPYLGPASPLGESPVLAGALAAARGPTPRPWVTFDARALDGAVTGTQVHILELIRALARTGALRLRVLVRRARIDGETLKLLRALPGTEILAAEDADATIPSSPLFHRPQQAFETADVALALALGERFVLSQLDLIAYRNPGYFADASAWQDYRRASRLGLSAAERVVVFSEHTRGELLADALAEDERIRIVPPGLDHRTSVSPRRPAAFAEAGAAARGEEDPRGFLLCLGTDFRHKNRVFALRLLAVLRERHGWQGSLVLAGTHIENGSSRELERAELARHPQLGEAVVDLGAVDEQEKAWLLERAAAVVYPSAYEGFGLVPFESALSGVPCVFAPWSSLAEAAPQGAATIVPWDPVASAAAVHTLLSDPQARARHVEALAGAGRALTWDAAAAAMVAVYREAVAAPVRVAATLSRDAVERERKLTCAHERVVDTLIGERELVLRDYDEQIAQLGPARGLIGPRGSLPEDLQRALLALSARPGISRPIYGGLARMFAAMRALSRGVWAPLARRRRS
jgi:glycosyltransferase involved in cell wall biosynthesis